MAERTVAALQPSAAAGHADALFSFLQQALDIRQSAPALDAQQVERAAITALVALVMKLNERQFKPLFLRLHAWSTTHPIGQPGGLLFPTEFSEPAAGSKLLLSSPDHATVRLNRPEDCNARLI